MARRFIWCIWVSLGVSLGTDAISVLVSEVTDDKQIADAVKFVDSVVGQDGLNLLINNAATLEREGAHLPLVERAHLNRHFDVNVASPILISQV